MHLRRLITSSLLLLTVIGAGGGLAAWKQASFDASAASAASQPEPMEVVTAARAQDHEHLQTTTAIGTVRALRSITLRNELAGTVSAVRLETGSIVEPGTVLVALDVSVEEAELRAQQAEASLAETLLGRLLRASQQHGASEADVDRARAQRDVARARVARIEAIIARKTVRAPFRARVGLADVHPGQYLNEGTELTTLQGVDEQAHVDFTVAQSVAAGLRVGQAVAIARDSGSAPLQAEIVGIDARVDPLTRNATVRAKFEAASDSGRLPAPGSSVRVRVPLGPARQAVVIPVSALRKGPDGDHVFVLGRGEDGSLRAHSKRVVSGAVLGDEVVIEQGLAAGEQVAASGSFKLHEGVLVAVAGEPSAELQAGS